MENFELTPSTTTGASPVAATDEDDHETKSGLTIPRLTTPSFIRLFFIRRILLNNINWDVNSKHDLNQTLNLHADIALLLTEINDNISPNFIKK